MSIRILESTNDNQACFYCSTSGWAFGPVMGSAEEANAFLDWIPGDPRTYSDSDLEQKYSEFVRQYVCVCGSVADGVEGQDEEEDGKPTFGYPRTDGDRFICDFCKKEKASA